MRPFSSRGLGALVLLAALSGPSSGHPHNYVQAGLGDLVTACVDVDATVYTLSGVGGACIQYDNGHVKANALGYVTLSISDLLGHPVSGFYCQDVNGDQVCGGPGDPGITFCGSVLVQQGATWYPSSTIVVRVHGPVFGLGPMSPCTDGPLEGPTFGSVGSVYHS